MKFVLAVYGMRGDIEPSVVVGRELLRRGHDVRMAVPPNLVGFAEAAGLAAVAYGLDSRALVEAAARLLDMFLPQPLEDPGAGQVGARNFGVRYPVLDGRGDHDALTSLADGADLLIAGLGFEQFAANVAEYYDIPLATLHFLPMRANGQVLPFLPAPLGRSAMKVYERLSWSGAVKKVEEAQRRELGLPEATMPLAATDRRTRVAGNPGLRRGLLSRAGSRMDEMRKASGRLSAR